LAENLHGQSKPKEVKCSPAAPHPPAKEIARRRWLALKCLAVTQGHSGRIVSEADDVMQMQR